MRNSALGVGFAILGIGLMACAEANRPAPGGETNWLKHCSNDEGCGRGSCVCGVCTTQCSVQSACAGGFAGTCVSVLDTVGAHACEVASPPPAAGLCLPACTDDAACGPAFACRDGVCIPAAVAARVDASRGSDVHPSTDAGTEAPSPDAQPSTDAGTDAVPSASTDAAVMQDAGAAQPNSMPTPVAVTPAPAKGESSCPNGIYPGSAEIRLRSDIDKLRDCSQVAGDLLIIATELEDLSGLEGLRVVEGRLSIAPTDETATNLSAPSTLPVPLLKSLKGLEGLRSVASLVLIGLPITTLEPLSALETAPLVWVRYMPGLRDLKGLAKLDWEMLNLVSNPELLSLEGLRVQASEHRTLEISDSPKLSDLTALQALVSVSEHLSLSSLDIADLSGLRGLQRVGDASTGLGSLSIAGCARLRDLSGLGELKSTAGLILSGNENLETLAGIALAAPPLTLGITGSPRVESLAPAIPAGAWNANAVDLERMPGIKSLRDLGSLQSATSLMIQECDGLKDLTGLEQLKTAGQVFITRCAGLTNLAGLDNLTTVTGVIGVGMNPVLTSVRQLGGVKSISWLELRDNVMLPQCEVDWIAQRLNVPLAEGLNGPPGMCQP